MRKLFVALLLAAGASLVMGAAAEENLPGAGAPAAQPAKAPGLQPATPAAPQHPGAPQEVSVGLYVLSLGKFDVASGSFVVDFYLDLKSKSPIPDNSFEFMNGRASTLEKIEDKQENGMYEKFYRIMADLNTPVDLKRFPFDAQKMQIIIENKTEGLDKVKYVPAQEGSGLDRAIYFPGWLITAWDAAATQHDYPAYNEKYSRYDYTVRIERIKWNAFLKTFLPVFVLMLIVMSSFVLNPDQITTRLAAISSALVASVMFHISISSQIPPVGYLTFADKFMAVTFCILLACFFLSIRVFILQSRKETERAMKLHKATEWIVYFGMPIIYLSLFLFVK